MIHLMSQLGNCVTVHLAFPWTFLWPAQPHEELSILNYLNTHSSSIIAHVLATATPWPSWWHRDNREGPEKASYCFSDILSARTWMCNWSWLLDSGTGLGSYLRVLEILCNFKIWTPSTCVCMVDMRVQCQQSNGQRNKEHIAIEKPEQSLWQSFSHWWDFCVCVIMVP